MRQLFIILTASLSLTALTAIGQTTDSIQTKIIGKWTMTSSISKNKNECKKYYKSYTLTLNKDGNYFQSITSSSDNSTITESGKYKIDNVAKTIYFFDIKLTIPGQNATSANYQFAIQEANKDRIVFRQCLCDVSETDTLNSTNCKTAYTKMK